MLDDGMPCTPHLLLADYELALLPLLLGGAFLSVSMPSVSMLCRCEDSHRLPAYQPGHSLTYFYLLLQVK